MGDEPVVTVEQDFGQHVALVAVEAGVLLDAQVVEAVGDGVAASAAAGAWRWLVSCRMMARTSSSSWA